MTPSDEPTKNPTNNPTLNPFADALIVTDPPTRDADDMEYSVEVTFTISNIVGVESTDFINNNELRILVVNSTRTILYLSIRDLSEYNFDRCDDVWNCFGVTIQGRFVYSCSFISISKTSS